MMGQDVVYVVCFYWQGDRWQQTNYAESDKKYVNRQQPFLDKVGKVKPKLPSRYVNNLYRGVERFATRPFHFVCFSNEKLNVCEGVDLRPFPFVTRMGVLPRMFVFSQEAGFFGHQVLCLDLDLVIVGSLKDIMNYTGLFCARSKFKRGEEYKLDGDIFSFRAGPETERMFWLPFIENVAEVEKQTKGRERYWFRQVAGVIADRWDYITPGQIVSFKRHVRKWVRNRKKGEKRKKIDDSLLPTNARIVSCHGTPRPDQIEAEWVKKYWQ